MNVSGSKVIFRKCVEPTKTTGGLYMPANAKEGAVSKGIVISSPYTWVEEGIERSSKFDEGDTIAYFTKSAINVEGDIYVVDMKNVVYFETTKAKE